MTPSVNRGWALAELETRQSHGLDQFCSLLEERPGLAILDLAGASQGTINFITGLGHRLCFDDFLEHLDISFAEGSSPLTAGAASFYENQSDPHRVEEFFRGALDFPDAHFDGALLWDALEYLAPPLLARVMGRLHATLRPGAVVLALFHAQEQKAPIPSFSYRIQDRKTIAMTRRGDRQRAQFFNNRGLERLFEDFKSVKFFLTRDAIREVIVRR